MTLVTVVAKAQNNAAALSGFKSKEFGGEGYSQLVFDDTPEQLRVQLATTQHATQLNLGHLIHQADNHRGSFRGRGFELRTDAFGAVRATQGVLLTTYGIGEATPAGDNAAGMALLKQAVTMAESFGKTAKTHETTALAGSVGTVKASRSALSEDASPLKALHTAASGMVKAVSLDEATGDSAKRTVQASPDRVPHTADPIVAITAKAGLTTVAGQDLQFASGDAITLQAGRDIHLASGTHLHLQTGQSLGLLAGAVKAGQGAKGTGLTAIAAQGPVQLQAQAGQAQVAAKGLVNVQSANAHIDWAAAKKITLTTSGGAQVVIEAGGITVQAPGKILVKAATKSFVGADTTNYNLPKVAQVPFDPIPMTFKFTLQDLPGKNGAPRAFTPWHIFQSKDGASVGKMLFTGETDADGNLKLTSDQEKQLAQVYAQAPGSVWVKLPGQTRKLDVAIERDHWSDTDKAAEALAAMDYSLASAMTGESNADPLKMLSKTDTGRGPHVLWDELKKL